MTKKKCSKCKGWGIVKDIYINLDKDVFKCINCKDKICYMCENSKNIYIECNECYGSGEVVTCFEKNK